MKECPRLQDVHRSRALDPLEELLGHSPEHERVSMLEPSLPCSGRSLVDLVHDLVSSSLGLWSLV